MSGTTIYQITRTIDGVQVAISVHATPVGQAPNPSEGLGLVRTANGSDGRELINIIGDAIDGVIEALERPEVDTFISTKDLIEHLRTQGVFI